MTAASLQRIAPPERQVVDVLRDFFCVRPVAGCPYLAYTVAGETARGANEQGHREHGDVDAHHGMAASFENAFRILLTATMVW